MHGQSRHFALFLIPLLLHLALPLHAQWERLTQPGVEKVTRVIAAKNRLYASNEQALYRSDDLGVSWQWMVGLSSDFPGDLRGVATWGDTVFVLKGFDLLFSTDYGQTWDQMPATPPSLVNELRVMGHYLIGNFNGTYNKFNLVSGGPWVAMTPDLSGLQEEQGLWWGFRYGVAGNDTIFRSHDFGDTWEPVTTARIADFAVQGNTLLVVSSGGWYDDVLVRKTADQASAPWDTVSHPGDSYIELHCEHGHSLAHFLKPSGIYYLLASADGFDSWDSLNIPALKGHYITDGFVVKGSRWIVPGQDYGVSLSDDNGKNWYYTETGFRYYNPAFTPEFGNNIRRFGDWLMLERDYRPSVYSNTAGQTWFRPILPQSMPLQPTAYSQGFYFAWGSAPASSGDFCDSLYRSADGKSDWELIKPTGFTWCGYNLFGTEKYLFAYYHDGSFPVLARSADAGLNWEFLNVPDVPGGQLDTMSGKLIWYNGAKIWVSGDDGQSFSQSGTFPSDVNFQQITLAGGTIYAHRFENNIFTIRKSVDLGQNWVNHTQNLTDNGGNPRSVIAFDHRHGKTVVLTLTPDLPAYYHLWVSDNDGATWRPVLALPNVTLNPIVSTRIRLTDDYLYVYHNVGYRLPIGRLENYSNTGHVFLDANANGQADPGEAGLAGLSIQGLPYGLQTVTDTAGQYNLYGNFLADTLRPVLPSPHAVSAPAFRVATSPAQGQDFAIQIGSGIQDLHLRLTPHAPFRPGFETAVSIECSNLANPVAAPFVRLVLPAGCEFQAAQPAPSAIDGDTIVWVFPALQFLEKQSLLVTLKTQAATPIGTPILLSALAGPLDTDATPADNLVLFQDNVVGSYDPNDKIVAPANYVTADLAAGKPLMYTIRFQNTGTYPATTVRIADTLSGRLDWTTFRVEQSSHPVAWDLLEHGVVEFKFPGIVLPFAAEDEAGSQGFVRYSIRPKPGLMIGEGVTNTAYIYFDFNTAIITNTVESILQEMVHVWEKRLAGTVRILPNPATTQLRWKLPEQDISAVRRLAIFSLSGRQVMEMNDPSGEARLDVGNLPAGSYFLGLETEKGWYAGKFEKL